MPRIDHGNGGDRSRRRRVLSDEQRAELWQWCLRQCRPDPRLYRRSHGGWVSVEQEAENHAAYEAAKEQAERAAEALFEQRLREIESRSWRPSIRHQ